MNIIESSKYIKSRKKILKNKIKEQQRLDNIILLISACKNLYELVISPLSTIYHIENKSGNLKEYYTARINSKIRLIMKPIGKYPYNMVEITDIEFINVDNSHYGEG